MIRPVMPADSPALVALADATGIFAPDEARALLGGVLADYHAGLLGARHRVAAWTRELEDEPSGWVYFSPSFKAEDVWDLWWIGVTPSAHGAGVADELLAFVEREVLEAGGRVLVIETSATEPLARARRFYLKKGYRDCGRIPDFYAPGDDKITFAKTLRQPEPPPAGAPVPGEG